MFSARWWENLMTFWDYIAIGALFFAATIGAGCILIAIEKTEDK